MLLFYSDKSCREQSRYRFCLALASPLRCFQPWGSLLKMWKGCGRQATKQTLKSGQDKQFVKACLFLIKKTQQLSQINLLHTCLLPEIHQSFLGVCVFIVSYKLSLQVDLGLTNHTVSSELMFESQMQAGVISWCSVAPKLHFNVSN